MRKRFEWSPQARGDLKEIERDGKLSGTRRLRVGDWRVRFQEKKGDIVYILAVGHRSEAYR